MSTEVHVGRQPIHDHDLDVVAYELRYRGFAGNTSEETATRTFLAGMIDLGLERIATGLPVTVRLPQSMLRDGTLAHLPWERIVFELGPEDAVDDELEGLLRSAADTGVRLRIPDPVAHPQLGRVADIASMVAVDVTWLDPAARRRRRAELARPGTAILAAGIDHHDVHEDCMAAGYDLFTGRILATPNVVSGRRLSSQRGGLLQLLTRLDDPTVSVDHLEEAIASDPQLSYQLLRYVNSAFIGLRREVDSVRRAIVIVGPPVLRQLATMLLMEATSDRPVEAGRIALVRAGMCRAIGEAMNDPRPAYSTVGLLSTVDLLTGVDLTTALDELPLTPDVRGALLHHEGVLGRVLHAVKLYERFEWNHPVLSSFDPYVLSHAYFTAVAWADDLLAALDEVAAEPV